MEDEDKLAAAKLELARQCQATIDAMAYSLNGAGASQQLLSQLDATAKAIRAEMAPGGI